MYICVCVWTKSSHLAALCAACVINSKVLIDLPTINRTEATRLIINSSNSNNYSNSSNNISNSSNSQESNLNNLPELCALVQKQNGVVVLTKINNIFISMVRVNNNNSSNNNIGSNNSNRSSKVSEKLLKNFNPLSCCLPCPFSFAALLLLSLLDFY